MDNQVHFLSDFTLWFWIHLRFACNGPSPVVLTIFPYSFRRMGRGWTPSVVPYPWRKKSIDSFTVSQITSFRWELPLLRSLVPTITLRCATEGFVPLNKYGVKIKIVWRCYTPIKHDFCSILTSLKILSIFSMTNFSQIFCMNLKGRWVCPDVRWALDY